MRFTSRVTTRVTLRQVRLGRRYGDSIEVLAGLSEGETVATDPVAAGIFLKEQAGAQLSVDSGRKLGFSGSLASKFQDSKITPLLALTGLLLGLFAIAVTPREEEPQINVTFANIFVPFPGASAVEVENVVAVPMEQVLAEIEGVKHTYSVSRPGMAVLTIQFEVGEDTDGGDRAACITRSIRTRTGSRPAAAYCSR